MGLDKEKSGEQRNIPKNDESKVREQSTTSLNCESTTELLNSFALWKCLSFLRYDVVVVVVMI